MTKQVELQEALASFEILLFENIGHFARFRVWDNSSRTYDDVYYIPRKESIALVTERVNKVYTQNNSRFCYG